MFGRFGIVSCLLFFWILQGTAIAEVLSGIEIVEAAGAHHIWKGSLAADKAYVFLPGSDGDPLYYQYIIGTIGDIDNVLALSVAYYNKGSINSICGCNDPCYPIERDKRIFGSPEIPPNSDILTRLSAVFNKLGTSQFISCPISPTNPRGICWDKIVIAGASQGAGMAARIGKYFGVRRVNQYAGTVDNYCSTGSLPFDTAATWTAAPGATSSVEYYGLVHLLDQVYPMVDRVYTTMVMPGNWATLDGADSAPHNKNNSNYICPGNSFYEPNNYHGCVSKDPVYARFWKWAAGY